MVRAVRHRGQGRRVGSTRSVARPAAWHSLCPLPPQGEAGPPLHSSPGRRGGPAFHLQLAERGGNHHRAEILFRQVGDGLVHCGARPGTSPNGRLPAGAGTGGPRASRTQRASPTAHGSRGGGHRLGAHPAPPRCAVSRPAARHRGPRRGACPARRRAGARSPCPAAAGGRTPRCSRGPRGWPPSGRHARRESRARSPGRR